MKWLFIVLVCSRVLFGVEVSFSREIAPVLKAKCLACHNAEKAKGKYRVDTFVGVMKGVVKGKAAESELFKRLVTSDPDDRMPQEDEPLQLEQIELFRRWIAEGAKLDVGTPEMALSELLPRVVHPAAPEMYKRAVPVVAL